MNGKSTLLNRVLHFALVAAVSISLTFGAVPLGSQVTHDNSFKTFAAAKKVKVTFYPHGGAIYKNYKSLKTLKRYVKYNKKIGKLPRAYSNGSGVYRNGYTFLGWYKAKSGGVKVTSKTKVKKAVKLYAHWAKTNPTVTFNANGGTVNGNTTKSYTFTYKSTYGSLPYPTRTGYNFLGWYTKIGGGSRITADSKVTIKGNKTFYAHWALKKSIWLTDLTPFSMSDNSVYESGSAYAEAWHHYSSWTDNLGQVYSDGILGAYFVDNPYYPYNPGLLENVPYPTITYLLDGNYKTFSGTAAISYESRNLGVNLRYKIYADNVLVYTSPELTGGSNPLVRPVDFSVDVTNVEFLKIERIFAHEGWNTHKTAFVNATLKR